MELDKNEGDETCSRLDEFVSLPTEMMTVPLLTWPGVDCPGYFEWNDRL